MSIASRPMPRPGVLDIEAYVPGKSAAPAGVKLHKLSSNETPLGPSPKAVEAFQSLASKLEFYPDGSQRAAESQSRAGGRATNARRLIRSHRQRGKGGTGVSKAQVLLPS